MTSDRRRKTAIRERAASACTSFTTAMRDEPGPTPAPVGPHVPIGRDNDGSLLFLGPGEHLVVAGRPGAGKTVFGQGFVTECLLRGADVFLFDFGYGSQVENAYAFARPYCAGWATDVEGASRLLAGLCDRDRRIPQPGAPLYLLVDEVSNLLEPDGSLTGRHAQWAARLLHALAVKGAPVDVRLVLMGQRMRPSAREIVSSMDPNPARLLLGRAGRPGDPSILSGPDPARQRNQVAAFGGGVFESAHGPSYLVSVPGAPVAVHTERLARTLGPRPQG